MRSHRPLVPTDAPAIVALRREALTTAPLVFGSSPEDDRVLSPGYPFGSLGTSPDSAIFGAFEGAMLVGMAGLIRGEKLKERHRAYLWGMWVTPGARGRGHGAALLVAAIERARTWSGVERVDLSVTDAAPEALRLYERFGFRTWGHETRALLHGGRGAGERHMALNFDRVG